MPVVADDVQVVSGQKWRGHVRHRPFVAPGDMRIRNVAAAPQPNRHGALFRRAPETEDQAVPYGGGADEFLAGSLGKPQGLAGLRREGHSLGCSGQNQLIVSVVPNDHGRRERPQVDLRPVSPDFLAGGAVEHDDKRFAVLLAVDDESLAEQDRAGGETVLRLEVSGRDRPHDPARKIDGDNAHSLVVDENSVDSLIVRGRCTRGGRIQAMHDAAGALMH